MGPKSNNRCPYKKRTHGYTHREGHVKIKAEPEGRIHKPGNTRIPGNHQELGDARESSPLRASRRNLTPSFLTSGLLNHEKVKFPSSVCGNLLKQPWEMNRGLKEQPQDMECVGPSAPRELSNTILGVKAGKGECSMNGRHVWGL